MSIQLKGKMLGLAAIAALGMVATTGFAQSKDTVISYTTDDKGVVPYVIDSRNAVATSGAGLCWRTGFWSPAAAQTAFSGSFPAGCVCDKDIVPADMCKVPEYGKTAATPAASADKIKLSADTLFDFDSANLRPAGRTALDGLAAKARALNLEVILAVGHTDRIGSDSYNKRLSERRAASVKSYLVSKGIDAKRIYTEGKGESQPVTGTKCNGITERAALISCLQPDRRVEVEVIGTK
jgi:OmpA-OmpF porin, OOP family